MKSLFTKERIWRDAKSIVFGKMDKDLITPERADEILLYVKKYATDIETEELARQFYAFLGEQFVELRELRVKFHMEKEEELEKLITLLVDYFMGHGSIENAENLMQRLSNSDDLSVLMGQLEREYPKEVEIIRKSPH